MFIIITVNTPQAKAGLDLFLEEKSATATFNYANTIEHFIITETFIILLHPIQSNGAVTFTYFLVLLVLLTIEGVSSFAKP